MQNAQPIDFFFNDGHHEHDAVLEYFEQAKPYLSTDAVVVFDDIDWSDGMQAAWNTIRKDDRVMASVDLGAIGVVVLGEGRKQNYDLPL